MADLILPGTIPGLLRLCSLVAVVSGSFVGRKGVIVDLEPGARRAVVALQADAHHDASVEWLALSDLALILTDATGRAHAAWWLATRFEYMCETTHGPTGAVWRRQRWGWPVWGLTGPAPSVDYPGTEHTGETVTFGSWPENNWQNAWFESAKTEGWFQVIPALDDLDPSEPRLLPDGYRWVDAEALRRVVLHVAGVSGA